MNRSLCVLVCVLAAACTETTLEPNAEVPMFMKGGGNGNGGGGAGGPNGDDPLRVTFNGDVGLTSDLEGVYIHDVDKVKAIMRAIDNLNFLAGDVKGKKSPLPRCVNVTVPDPTDPMDDEPLFKGCVNLEFNTSQRFGEDVHVGALTTADGEQRTTGAAGWTDSGGSVHKIRYGKACEDNTEEIDNKITAVATSETTWRLTASNALYCRDGIEQASVQVDLDVTLELIN